MSPKDREHWFSSTTLKSKKFLRAPVNGGLSLLLCCSTLVGTAVLAAKKSKGLGGKLISFRLGRIIEYCLSYPKGMVWSFEFVSIVTTCGSREATDGIVIISIADARDSSVEFIMSRVLFLGGLCSPDDCFELKMSESWNQKSYFRSILKKMEILSRLLILIEQLERMTEEVREASVKFPQAGKLLMFPR